jgi:hypothetical protein
MILSNNNNSGDILTCDFCEEKNNNVIPLFECDDYAPLVCLKCYVDYFYIKYYNYVVNRYPHLTIEEKEKIYFWVPEPEFYIKFKDTYINEIKATSQDPRVATAIERFKEWHNKDLIERSNKKLSSINEATLIQHQQQRQR